MDILPSDDPAQAPLFFLMMALYASLIIVNGGPTIILMLMLICALFLRLGQAVCVCFSVVFSSHSLPLFSSCSVAAAVWWCLFPRFLLQVLISFLSLSCAEMYVLEIII